MIKVNWATGPGGPPSNQGTPLGMETEARLDTNWKAVNQEPKLRSR
jgi:hypothetical protein